ncbi:MAG: BMP family ABC transporter substrate-binding protein [Chloroflexota bacterium]|nr:BMP family ABC transporter substrate-binding protein [Chloroflexota bacterium]MDE3192258.1 BMP family ABC transporter substrate-binding protein [Chloroflexota bacterium]
MKRLLAFALMTMTVAAACGGGAGTASPSPSAAATSAAPSKTAAPTAAAVKVGLVTDVGGLNDKSFNALANQGRLDAEKDLKVQTSVTESKKQEDYVPNLTNYAQQKYDLVIAVGFLMTNATWKVAKQFPDVKFAIIDGAPANDKGDTENLPNVANLFFKEQEAGYLVGVIAATMAKNKVGKATHNTVCSMGGIPIPPVDRYIAGYQDAVKTVSPTTTILNGYSNDFVDQAKGKEVGLNHISKNCDILFQVAGASGLGYIQAAKDKGVYAIGVDADQAYVAPGTVLTSALKRVNKAVYDTIKAVVNKTFKAGDNSFNATNDGVGYGTLDPAVPADAKAAADKALADIKSGKITPKDAVQVK